ncbi:MAG: diguanylate cyclase [Acidimicrobiia bacterium]
MANIDDATGGWFADPALGAIALNAMAEGVVVHDPDGAIVVANPAAGRILGLSIEQLTGRTPMDPRWRTIDDDGRDWPGDTHPAAVTLQTGQAVTDRAMGVHRPDGSLRWLSVSSYPVELRPGATGAVAIFIDRTDWFAAVDERDLAQARLDAIFQHSRIPMGIVRLEDLVTLRVNDAFCQWAGTEADHLVGAECTRFLVPSSAAKVPALTHYAATHGTFETMLDAMTDRGEQRSVYVTGNVIDDPMTESRIALVQIMDLTEWMRSVEAESRATSRFEAVFEHTASPLALVELAASPGRLDRVNHAMARMAGCDVGDLVGVPFASMFTQDDAPEFGSAISRLVAGEATQVDVDARINLPDGSEIEVSVSLVAIYDAGVKATYAVAHVEDNRERQAREEIMAWQIEHDTLTGLASRAAVGRHLEQIVHDPQRRATTTVLFFDLDRFKAVNDLHGHDAGDVVLREVGKRVSGSLRAGDLFARYGGDEFVVVLEQVSSAVVDTIAGRILGAVALPIDVGTATVEVGASIGIAVPVNGDADDVIRRADAAMYEAKRLGKGRFHRAD